MTYAAVRIDHGLLVMPRFCAGLMVVLVVAEMPLGLAGLFMLAIGGRYRPVELEWQDQQKQDQAEPPHEWLKKCVAGARKWHRFYEFARQFTRRAGYG
nr:hypothetical protein [Ralstonia pickettii]